MKIKWGAMVVDGRGKLGGHVASKNRGGAYFRTKVTPSNPQTPDQTTVRLRLAEFSQQWPTLTQSQRKAWNSSVSAFQKTDIFGDIKKPSGINLFVKLNANLASVGGGALLEPPLPAAVVPITGISASASDGGGTFSLAWTSGPVDAAAAIVVQATAQVSPGKSYVKNLFRSIQVLPGGDTTPTSIYTAYINKFGALVEGQKIGIRLVAINTETGQASPPEAFELIVAA